MYVSGYPVKQVVDPVGAGDGFAAGIISGMLRKESAAKMVQRANAIGAIVVVIRQPDKNKVEDIAVALIEGGTSALYVTVESVEFISVIEMLHKKFGDKALVDAVTAKAAIQAGPDFVFSPSFDEETVMEKVLFLVRSRRQRF